MKIIDTHCHLDFDAYDKDRNDVLERALAANVAGFVVPGVQRDRWDNLISFCGSSDDLYCALGLHPMFIEQHNQQHVMDLEKYVKDCKPVAIGEIGLDFYDRTYAEKQVDIFEQQLKLACKRDLPVILHVRKAHEEVLACLKKYPVIAGIAHAFNGSLQQAERYLQYNFKFGFGGMLTYERSTKLRKLAQELPLETIVLETDSPDMTVEQYRGERNSPEYLPFCLQAVADVKQLDIERVAQVTTHNAQEVLKLN